AAAGEIVRYRTRSVSIGRSQCCRRHRELPGTPGWGCGREHRDRRAGGGDIRESASGRHLLFSLHNRNFHVLCSAAAVRSSAGKNASIASSDNVTSSGVPNTVVVL